MCNYGGFILMICEALGLLALAAILASLGGVVWLALVVALMALILIWRWPTSRARLEQSAAETFENRQGFCLTGYCEHCGTERPGLICPMCGASVLNGKEE